MIKSIECVVETRVFEVQATHGSMMLSQFGKGVALTGVPSHDVQERSCLSYCLHINPCPYLPVPPHGKSGKGKA